MKLHAGRDVLLKPLQAVIGVVERRQTMPILSNVLLVAREGVLAVTATDLEVELVATADVEELDHCGSSPSADSACRASCSKARRSCASSFSHCASLRLEFLRFRAVPAKNSTTMIAQGMDADVMIGSQAYCFMKRLRQSFSSCDDVAP